MAAKRKRITLSEFRAWLQGVEELQTAGWSPNAEQWKLIRDKIDAIVESKMQVVEQQVHVPNNGPRPQFQQQPHYQPQYSGPVPFIPPPPPVPGGVPADGVVTGVAPRLGTLPPVEGTGGPGGPSSFA